MPAKRIPLWRSLLLILGTTCLISGSATGAYFTMRHFQRMRHLNDKYLVRSIEAGDKLPANYLAQLIGLSVDMPVNLYALNLTQVRERLLRSPLIREARLLRKSPSTLVVDLDLRKPVAAIQEFTNLGIDSDGRLFPIDSQVFPQVCLGIDSNLVLPERPTLVALEMLRYLEDKPLHILRVDTSMIDHESMGQRQIVVIVEDRVERGKTLHRLPRILRLEMQHYKEAIDDYCALDEELRKGLVETQEGDHFHAPLVVDLRLPGLAYLSEEGR